ncbi:hypothetical protein Ciccas_010725 [Cichlidogyrus casuarinus]|uniref:DUF4371 domain-containing protein n=1 Tax=Cichlidogyrus casuarinus TaxID=1844966 RepID=A0ABD2PU57_9PLAT
MVKSFVHRCILFEVADIDEFQIVNVTDGAANMKAAYNDAIAGVLWTKCVGYKNQNCLKGVLFANRARTDCSKIRSFSWTRFGPIRPAMLHSLVEVLVLVEVRVEVLVQEQVVE